MENEFQNPDFRVPQRSVTLGGESDFLRRDFLKLAGLDAGSCLSGCASGTSSESWTPRDVAYLNSSVGRGGSGGWAAWQGTRLVVSANPSARGTAYSITKSLATLAATTAAVAGWLAPSERVVDTISEWRGDSLKSQITVLMLLQQVSGLESGGIPLYRNQPSDKGKAAAAGDKAKHACKGMNECKGQGACKTGDAGCAGKNSCKGKGGCATAKHDCKGKNECKGQGGCKTGDKGCAGKNTCKGKGGCSVPVKH